MLISVIIGLIVCFVGSLVFPKEFARYYFVLVWETEFELLGMGLHVNVAGTAIICLRQPHLSCRESDCGVPMTSIFTL